MFEMFIKCCFRLRTYCCSNLSVYRVYPLQCCSAAAEAWHRGYLWAVKIFFWLIRVRDSCSLSRLRADPRTSPRSLCSSALVSWRRSTPRFPACCCCTLEGIINWRLYIIIILFVVNLVAMAGQVLSYAYGNIKVVIFNLIIPGKIFHRNNNLVYCAFSPHKLSLWMGTNFSHCSKRPSPSTQAPLRCCMQRKHVGQLSTQIYFPMHRSVLLLSQQPYELISASLHCDCFE